MTRREGNDEQRAMQPVREYGYVTRVRLGAGLFGIFRKSINAAGYW
jgi:hypothetical protein